MFIRETMEMSLWDMASLIFFEYSVLLYIMELWRADIDSSYTRDDGPVFTAFIV